MRLRKRQSEVAESTHAAVRVNVAVQLIGPVARTNRYALTYVDSLGVIERFTFADVARDAARWADLLREHGVQPGDRVVVLAGLDRQWRCALLGVLLAGGTAVPCPAPTPVAELRAIAAHASAVLFVSARARPDLVVAEGIPVLSVDELQPRKAAREAQFPHQSMPQDVALILYTRDAAGLHGAMHTHASLLAQAAAGEHWLGVRKDERVWCTAADGSLESIWLLLAAWHEAAEIVVVDLALDPEAQLELLDKLHPAAVWFSDDEYALLAAAAAPAWVDLGSIRRALANDERADGATAFQHAFGAKVAPVYGWEETGVATEERLIVEEAERAEREAAHAEERHRTEDERRREEERRREAAEQAEREQLAAQAVSQAEEERQRAQKQKRDEERREKQQAKERRLAEKAERAEREAAQAEEHRRAEEAVRAERARTRGEERRRAEEEKRREKEGRREAKRREHAERAATKQRLLVEEAERAEREAAQAEKRREDERRRDAAMRAERERLAAEAAAHRANEKRKRDEERRREEESRRKAAKQAERERLAPDVLSRIGQYGRTARPVDPDTRRDAEESRERARAVNRDERRDTK
jgi:hypothetical protein